jgi:glycosyltransferase involved in cell wall biosynthesis
MLRIVHVVSALVKGGAERAVVDLAAIQSRNGCDVTIVAGWKADEKLLRAEIDPSISVEYAGDGERGRYSQALKWAWRRRAWLRQCDVLHVHLTYGAVIGSGLYLLRSGPRPIVVETYHASGMPIPAIQSWVHRQLARARDSMVFMAEDSRWNRFRRNRPYPRSALIWNGLADPLCLSRTSPEAQSYRRSSGLPAATGLVIGTIGRLVAERRPELVVRAFAEAARLLRPNAHFLFVGDGPERASLRRLGKELGIGDRLHFPGLALDPAPALAQMDLYVSVNVGNVTGLAGVQAAMCAVPTVAVQLDSNHSSAESDWIWSAVEPAAVGAEIARLANDEAARRDRGLRQRQFAKEKFSIARMEQSYRSLYSDLIRSNELR